MRLAIAALIAMTGAACSMSPIATKRSYAAKAEFMRQQPCPATGKAVGACPGWIVDHIKPLACGGPDAPNNMQWQTVADAKAKDKWERSPCR